MTRDEAIALAKKRWSESQGRVPDWIIDAIMEAARPTASFQPNVRTWLNACFGPEIAGDRAERNHRFLEESIELVQACGCTQSEAHQLVDYVYGRPAGEVRQEVGGVMMTLAALCLAHDIVMQEAGEAELSRVWLVIDKIRAKQAAKPKDSPLPMAATPAGDPAMPVVAWFARTLGISKASVKRQEVDDWIGSDGDCAEPIRTEPLVRQSDALVRVAAAEAQAGEVEKRHLALITALKTHAGDTDGWEFGLGRVRFEAHGPAEFLWATQDDIDRAIDAALAQQPSDGADHG